MCHSEYILLGIRVRMRDLPRNRRRKLLNGLAVLATLRLTMVMMMFVDVSGVTREESWMFVWVCVEFEQRWKDGEEPNTEGAFAKIYRKAPRQRGRSRSPLAFLHFIRVTKEGVHYALLVINGRENAIMPVTWQRVSFRWRRILVLS